MKLSMRSLCVAEQRNVAEHYDVAEDRDVAMSITNILRLAQISSAIVTA
jgi:hypothetical protein